MNKVKQVTTYGTVTEDCAGLVGSFGDFNRDLKKKGFSCAAVKVTYTFLKRETAKSKRFMKALKSGEYQKGNFKE